MIKSVVHLVHVALLDNLCYSTQQIV